MSARDRASLLAARQSELLLTFRRDTGKSPRRVTVGGRWLHSARRCRSVASALALALARRAAAVRPPPRTPSVPKRSTSCRWVCSASRTSRRPSSTCSRRVELDPNNPEPHQLLGNLYLLRGDLDKAEEELREAPRSSPKRTPHYGPPFVAEVENSLGVVLVHQKRYDDAIAVLREAATNIVNRTPHLAWGNLGWAYYEKGQYTDAVVALDPGGSPSKSLLPGLLPTRDRPTSPARLRARRGSVDALPWKFPTRDARTCRTLGTLRGEARAQLGLRQDAIADFERCVELSADSEAGRACQGYLEATH